MNKGALWNTIQKAFDVKIEHPVHLPRQQSRVERIQRLMLASPRSEPVRKAEKIRFVDGVQHLNRGTLDDLVFQRRYSERSLPPVGLRYIHPTHRLGSVRSAFQPFREILEVLLQFLAVVPPRPPVHTWRGFLLQTDVRSEEHTSELQSHSNLVCRLLLDKKNSNLQDGSLSRNYHDLFSNPCRYIPKLYLVTFNRRTVSYIRCTS